MKKIIKTLLVVMVVVLALTACDMFSEKAPEPTVYEGHEGHNVTVINAVPATCSKGGLTEGAFCNDCKLMIVAQEKTPKLENHEWVANEDRAFTCELPGYTGGMHCKVCGIQDGNTVITPAHHVWGENYVHTEPTCGKAGILAKKCTVCEKVEKVDDIPATGNHDYSVEVPAKDYTCEENGYTAHNACSVCGAKDEAYEEIPAAHRNDDHGVCTVCGTAFVTTLDELTYALANADVIVVVGQIEVHGNITLPAGKILAGYDEDSALFGAQLYMGDKSEVYDLTFYGVAAENGSQIYAHDVSVVIDGCTFIETAWDSIQITTNVDDVVIYITNCYFLNELTAAVRYIHIEAYNVENVKVVVGGNIFEYINLCTDDAITIYGVKADNLVFAQNIAGACTEALGLAEIWVATLAEDGTYAMIDVSAGIQMYPDNHLVVDATCEHPMMCVACGATAGDVADHVDEDEDLVCDVCEVVLCNHEWNDGEVTTAPTCTEDGVKTFTCANCSATKTEAVEAIGEHSYVEDVIDATCTTAGTRTYECSVCHHSYDEEIPTVAHTDANADAKCDVCGNYFAPEVGTAFVLKMYHGGLSKIVYFNGTKGNYYFNIGDYTEAATLYLEATEDGYYMYMGTDTKTYINLTVSGKYVNAALSETASTVWVWNAELGILTTYVEVADDTSRTGNYYLGTFNTNNDLRPVQLEKNPDNYKVYAVVVPEHECDGEATCTKLATCSVCGLTHGELKAHDYTAVAATCTANAKCACGAEDPDTALGHTTENGTCERCGTEIGGDAPVQNDPVTVTAKYTGGTTTNLKEGSDKSNATQLGLDSSIFTVTVNKCDNTTAVGLNQNGTIRLYSGVVNKVYNGNGSELVISIAEGYTIKSIKVNLAGTVGTLQISADGTVILTTSTANTIVSADINGSSFVLKNVFPTDKTQVHINSIEIVYVEN